jgi:hypothetical protein
MNPGTNNNTDEHPNVDLGENNEVLQDQEAPLASGYEAPQVIDIETPEDEENPLAGPVHVDHNMWQPQPPQNYRFDRQQSTGMNSGQWGIYRQTTLSQGSNPQGMDELQNPPNPYPIQIYHKN